MYLNTNYQNSGAGALLNYIEKDYPLRNTVGREISQRERENFIDKSRSHNFEREIRISPDPEADVSQEQLEREAQRYLRDFTRESRSVRAVYAYHEDNGIPHVHAALTGERQELYMNTQELEHDRHQLEHRLERDLVLEHELAQELKLKQEQKLEQEYEHSQRQTQEVSYEFELRPEEELEHERELRHEQTLRQEQELEQEIEHTREIELEQEQKLEQEQSQEIDWW